MTDKAITIALAGNPNSGKTTVFNNLTGARQHVGNWPGVTVEKKEGVCTYKGRRINVVDLPGVYSLTAYSLDEVIARDFIVEGKPDVVVDVVDKNYLLIDGLKVRRRRVNYRHIEPIAETIDIKKGASHDQVEAAIKKAKLEKKMSEVVSIPIK